MKSKNKKYILWFKDIDKDDIPIVGGKGANLGEMMKFNIPVPDGFVVTSNAYYKFLEVNKLKPRIRQILSKIKNDNPKTYQEASEKIKKLILSSFIPSDIQLEIARFYQGLSFVEATKKTNIFQRIKNLFSEPLVAIRSSATAEDLPNASFAGQQASYLNITGENNVINTVRKCWASLFEARAIFYREENKFDHFKVDIAVVIQKMIQSEASGVMFTLDPITNQKNKIVIEAIYGLGELIVQGTATPDYYIVDKKSLTIEKKEINTQKIMMIKKGVKNKIVDVPKSWQKIQKINNKIIKELASIGKKIENHYFFPQDIEWGIEKDKIYILQSRPVTTINQKLKIKDQTEESKIKLPLILSGVAASPGIATGPVKIIHSAKEIGKVKNGEILVTEMTTPDFVPAMKKVVGIITDKGGRTCHAAIVSRELGIPCVVGTEKATKILKQGLVVSVNGGTGEVFRGGLVKDMREMRNMRDMRESVETKISTPPLFSVGSMLPLKTATKLYVNLAEPQLAQEVAKKNVDGVGLLRAEFMIAQIGIHPKKLIRERKQKLFVEKLSENMKIFCEQFNPRPVVYRATDFKTNEYRNLIGGKLFEPEEPNPMLGYRGAFRYIHDEEVFELELEAIKKVRNKHNLRNLWLMIPYVRTPQELKEVKKIIAASGLIRSPTFKLWMMVEIPSNVILLEKFIEVGIDGISIGSNDLTMLILGTDRDNTEVAPVFDERNEAVLWAFEKTIKTCRKLGVTTSICGQAPSVYPDLTEKLVEYGITSISVSPDMIDQTREIIYEAEKRLVNSKS